MRLLILTQGEYGKRFVENIRRHAPAHWQIHEWEAPRVLPPVIDYPEDYLPAEFPPADLILSVGEHPGLAELLPEIAARSGARTVLAPVDRSEWLPKGLVNQLRRWLADIGVNLVVPKPFCSLTEDSYGYQRQRVRYDDPLVAEFARHFGQPAFRIACHGKNIAEVEVLRDAACGCARFVAEGLLDVSADDAEYQAGMLHHHYPCLASMGIDPDFSDTIMHVSGRIMQEAVGREVKPAKTVVYFTPHGRVE